MPDIYTALAAITAEVGGIAKERENKQQGYKFRGIDDVYDALHGLFAKHGVTSVPEVLDIQREERPSKSGGVLIVTVAKIRYTFYARDGSFVHAVTIGEGMDSGDKSANKAMAGAHKYALVQVFSIPTHEGVDSENEDPEPAPKPTVLPPKTDKQYAYDNIIADLTGLLKSGKFTKDQCTEWRVTMDSAMKDADAVSALKEIHDKLRLVILKLGKGSEV
jgi:hypothetical protein